MSRVRIDPNRPPDEQLAERIMRRLLDEKLLTARHGKRMLAPLAEGELTVEDWQLALDIGDEKDRT